MLNNYPFHLSLYAFQVYWNSFYNCNNGIYSNKFQTIIKDYFGKYCKVLVFRRPFTKPVHFLSYLQCPVVFKNTALMCPILSSIKNVLRNNYIFVQKIIWVFPFF